MDTFTLFSIASCLLSLADQAGIHFLHLSPFVGLFYDKRHAYINACLGYPLQIFNFEGKTRIAVTSPFKSSISQFEAKVNYPNWMKSYDLPTILWILT